MATNRNNSLNRGFIGVDKRISNEGILRPKAEYLDSLLQGRIVQYDFTAGYFYTPVKISRLSNATFVNINGNLANNYDSLRLTCAATGGLTLGLLVESESINYIAYSSGNSETLNVYGHPFVYFTPNYTRGFTSTQGATSGYSIINFEGAVAPNGLTTSELIVPGGQVSDGVKNNYLNGIPVTAGSTHGMFSIFAKVYGVDQEGQVDPASGATAPTRLQFADINSGNMNVQFNILNGTVISQSGVSAAWIENYGNGWYRCSTSFRPNTSLTSAFSFNVCPYPLGHTPGNYGPTYKGFTGTTNGLTGMMIWGMSLELRRYYPTSYIFTGPSDSTQYIRGIASIRKADKVYIDNVGWLQSPGTLFVEYYRRDGVGNGLNIPTNTIIAANNVSGSFIGIDHRPSGATVALKWPTGFTTASGGVTGINRVAFSMNGVSGSNVQIVLNGATGSGIATSDFDIDTAQWLTIGSKSTGITTGYYDFYDGIIRKVLFYPKALTEQEMRDITRV